MKINLLILFIFIALYGCNEAQIKSLDNISSDNIINRINSNSEVVFVNRQIEGNLDFTKVNNIFTNTPALVIANVNSPLTFVECTFTDSIIGFLPDSNFAYLTSFNMPITFIKCKFEKDVNFRQTIFNSSVTFAQCEFNEEVHFEGSVFYGNLSDFKETTYNKLAKFTNASFYGSANFMNAQFNDIAEFNNCFFNRNATFSASNFVKSANFGNIEVRGYFKANYAIFSEKGYFDNCYFGYITDFVRITSKTNFIFTNNSFYHNTNFSEAFFDGNLNFSNNTFIKNNNKFDEFATSDSCNIIFDNNNTLLLNQLKVDILKTND